MLALIGLALLPQLWVRRTIKAHAHDRADFPGTGGAFARHLLDEMKLTRVGVEVTQDGDHYDPMAKTVRLLPQHFDGRSLSAVVIAAHEVGHAMQDATGYKPLAVRTKLAKQAAGIQRFAMIILLLAPVLVILAKSPAILVLQILAIALMIGMTVAMHATTLPVEFDASFKRALPILEAGKYIPEEDMPAAREILRAAAYTYVAAAAMSLLDVVRWARLLRF
ncbi:MAG: zinc metallopeptidase [Pseudomonadota bacterium]